MKAGYDGGDAACPSFPGWVRVTALARRDMVVRRIGMAKGTTVEAAERELTGLIYAALLGEGAWQDFLERLNVLVPGGVTTLFFHDQRSGEGGISLASGLDACVARDYAAYYSGLNPWMRNVAQTPLGVGIVGERIISRDDFVRTEYYADFLQRQDIEAGIGVTLWREDASSFLLSTLTARVDADANQTIADLLTRLAPHLSRAFRYYRTGRFGGALARFGLSLAESPHVGVVLVGTGMKVKAVSPRAEAFLADGAVAGLTVTGSLTLRDEASMAMLRQMLARDYTGPRSHGMMFHAHRVTLIRPETEGASGYFGGPTVAILLEEAPPHAVAADIGWLVRRFGLTRAETRVVDGIVSGLRPEQIANAAGTRRETVRAQLKAVYAKTGVNSQADLVRLALAHPLRR